MRRRTFIGTAAAAALAAPAIAQVSAPGSARVLRFVPEGNLANPDPVWTTTTVARNHGAMIWDTLYGLDANFVPRPQMLAGEEVSDDKLTWRFTLRDGLRFHDGEPVRSADCVASIQRWARRRPLGQRLVQVTDEMRALDDKSFQVRLKQPYVLMRDALSDNVFMMPERMARTDAFQQITEYVGSGPYRFLRDEWVSGSRAVYARFEGYQPRQEAPGFMAGGKQAHFDRVEWRIIDDSATKAAALRNGEVDWWQNPQFDLLELLRAGRDVRVETLDRVGLLGIIAFNHLHPPFSNPKLLRALLPAIDQQEFMEAACGSETSAYKVPAGFFTPGQPMANAAGLEVLSGKRDLELAKRLVKESGYAGERIALVVPQDYPIQAAHSALVRDVFGKLGLNVDYQSTDWGTLVSRRASREGVDKGGWSSFCTTWEGLTTANPAGNVPLRGNGLDGWFGWPTSPRLEGLRDRWFDAPDEAGQKGIAAEMQRVAFEEVPFIPTGQIFQPTAFRTSLRDMVASPFPVFWGVRKG